MPASPSPGTARALDTFVKLRRAVNAIGARLNPALLKEHRLTETQFGVLEALHHKGPMAQARLCEKLLVSGSNLTTVVDNLERRSWVRRLADPDDRRAHRVELTPSGRRIISRAFPGHATRITEVLQHLTREEQVELGRLCRKLGRAVAGTV
ncbi:MAG TPA: MarR family transcriptional regulator [Gemmatimonadales bacterium]|nr:MarR family transcriptional regulator [Gemmatimonadales bacterium]